MPFLAVFPLPACLCARSRSLAAYPFAHQHFGVWRGAKKTEKTPQNKTEKKKKKKKKSTTKERDTTKKQRKQRKRTGNIKEQIIEKQRITQRKTAKIKQRTTRREAKKSTPKKRKNVKIKNLYC